jgi:ubiquinone/menaquinone biosynthesis C-methylase UbiE
VSTSKDAARRRFDRWAGRYGADRRSRRNAAPQRAALAALALGPGDRFLDVGCGSGDAVRAAAELGARAAGVDLAPLMVARARTLSAGLENVEFVVGDSEALPFERGAFSALLCSSSFHHYPAPERALAEMRRVVEPGGRLAIADPNADLLAVRVADRILRRRDRGHIQLYRRAELAALATAAGFERVVVRPLPTRGFMLLEARAGPDPVDRAAETPGAG